MEPLLVPRPRRLVLEGSAVDLPRQLTFAGAHDKPDIGMVLRRSCQRVENAAFLECRIQPADQSDLKGMQGYSLRVGDGGVRIVGRSADGLRNGLMTFQQLLRQYGGLYYTRHGAQIPGMLIEDEPAFATRGVLLDVSRDRVPTLIELCRVVEELACLKYNHLQLYTEHTFAYVGHEEVWEGWSPITPDEVRSLDEHCRLFGVTLAANQNCFGHLASWLKRPRYMALAEIPGLETPWMFYQWERKGPFSLCPGDPGSIALVEDLLGQLLPCFSSGLVNINCDETADVGQGRSRNEVGRRGAAPVYFDYVNRVVDAVKGRGFRPMFWADIALSHPEAIGSIPPDMISLAWGYEPDSPFEKWCTLLNKAGREAWVCPGTSAWRSITGRTRERRGNLESAARAGVSKGAAGFLVCDWGDLGHRQMWQVSLNALAQASEGAWNGTTNGYDPRATSRQLFADRGLSVASWLDEMGDADAHLRAIGGAPGADGSATPLRNASVLFNDLHEPLGAPARVGPAGDWESVCSGLADLGKRMPAGLVTPLAEELRHVVDVACFAAERGALRRRPGGLDGDARRRLAESLRGIMAEHRRFWLRCSRPGGLEHSLSYYQTTLDELAAAPG